MKHIIFLSLLLASSLSFAQMPANTDPNCVSNAHDPFEPRVRMSEGPEKGLCINSMFRRSAGKLSKNSAARYFTEKEGSIVIANFSHQKKFWVAQIPVSKIKHIILQTQFFPIGPEILGVEISHVQMRFDFIGNAKINLVSQDSSEVAKTVSLKHMLLSIENIGPHGEKFDFMKGMKGYFNLVYRVVSLEDKYDWMITQQGHRVTQHLLKISPKDAQKVFLEGVARGTKRGSKTTYHSIHQSCSTELIKILKASLGTRDSARSFSPNAIVSILENRGLIAKELPTLNEEFRKVPAHL